MENHEVAAFPEAPEVPYKTEHLGHLGLVASTIKKLKIVDKINARLPLDRKKGGKISHGHRSAAMILNGLGYLTRTLYLSSHFFEDKPLDLLLGIDAQPENFNDDMLGRHLDEISAYGTTKLFSELAFEIYDENNLPSKSYNLDTTTMTLYGDYDEYQDTSPLPKLGYSKDHRPDLKQVTLSLTQASGTNMPLWMEALDGNSSDKKSFQETVRKIKEFHESLNASPDNLLFVVDAAFYTPEKLAQLSKVKWITRVPATHKMAKQRLATATSELSWCDVGNGYQINTQENEHEGIRQRWVLVHSAQAKVRALKTFYRRLDKQYQESHKKLWHLSKVVFSCEKDAKAALSKFEKSLNYHCIDYEIEPVMKYLGKGRPKKGEVPECVGYQCQAVLASHVKKIEEKIDCLGRFILATNELDNDVIKNDEILSEYKAQTNIEGGFRFLKRDEFELNHIFLKNPNRIGALMMIMTLCLMVYNFAQYSLRKTLENEDAVLPNQLGKPVKNPTMRWVFQLMSKITVLCLWDDKDKRWVKKICNAKKLQQVIVSFFGEEAKQIYEIPLDAGIPDYDKNQKPLHKWCGM